MFTATYGMAEIGKFPNLKDAFKAIYDRCIAEKHFPTVMFETIWVIGPAPRERYFIEDLTRIGHENGWLTEKGKWVA